MIATDTQKLCYLRKCVFFSQSQFRKNRNPFYNPFLDSYLMPLIRIGCQYFSKAIAVPCNSIYKVVFDFENVIDKTIIFRPIQGNEDARNRRTAFYIRLCLNRKSNRLYIGWISRNFKTFIFKGSPDQSHFIFEINVGKGRIRHRTTLKLNF